MTPRPAIMVRVEFRDREARERAYGLTSHGSAIQPTGMTSWIVDIDAAPKILHELADDGFEARALVKVF